MRARHVLSILLCLFVATSGVFATSQPEEPEGVITLHALMNNSLPQPPEDNRSYLRIEEEFGIKFDFEMAVGDIAERVALMIASGDYADITDAGGKDFWAAGALMPLEGYFDQPDEYPGLYHHFNRHMDYLAYEDGHIYRMPNDGIDFNNEHNGSPLYFNPGFWLKVKVLEDLGWPELPTTVAEFMQLIEDYANKYETTDDGQSFLGFQIMGNTSIWRWHPLRDAPMYTTGYIPEDGWRVDEAAGTVTFDRLTDTYYDYYQLVNEMYNKGLVDPAFATNDFDEWAAANLSGRTLGFYDMSWQTWWTVNDVLRERGEDGEVFVPLAVTMNEGDSLQYYRAPTLPNRDNGFALFVDTEYPERIMRMFDGLAGEEWQKYMHWGIEGEDYLVADDGEFYLTDEQRERQGSRDWRDTVYPTQLMSGLIEWEGFYNDGNGYSPSNHPAESRRLMGPMEQEMMDHYGMVVYHQLIPSTMPNSRFYSSTWKITNQTVLEGAAAIANQQIEDHQKEWLAQLVAAAPGEFDGLWDEYAAGYDDIDIQAIIDVYEEILKAAPEYKG